MNILFIVNGQDFAPITASFQITKEIRYDKVITTLDGTEHPIGRTSRDVLEVELFLTFEGEREDFKALSSHPLTVEYEDPDTGYHKRNFRLDCDLEQAFRGYSIVGTNVWKTGRITLRCLEVDR